MGRAGALAHVLASAGVSALLACTGADAQPDDAPTRPGNVETTTKTGGENPDRWRYLKPLRASVPEGASAVPLLEVANGRTGVARYLVAVADTRADPRIELWSFSQGNARGVLERVPDDGGAPPRVVRMSGGDPHAPELDRLREEMATPGVEITRPRGLALEEGDPPERLVELLARAAKTVADRGAEPTARAQALADVFRGVDDPVALERDALHRVLTGLADGPWTFAETKALGTRRRRLVTAGDSPLQLELTRTRKGWVLSDLRDAKPAVAPAESSAKPALEQPAAQ